MSLLTEFEKQFEFGVIEPSVQFKEGTLLTPSKFCSECVHPNGDDRIIQLCEKHWEQDKKEWARINKIDL